MAIPLNLHVNSVRWQILNPGGRWTAPRVCHSLCQAPRVAGDLDHSLQQLSWPKIRKAFAA